MLAVMEAVPREDACADVALLRRSLTRTRGHVTVRETLGSTVFLVGERAYKLRRHPSVGRAAASQREVELNDALAPGVALGVRAVVPGADGDGYDLAPSDGVRAIDHVVEMRRFAEADTMRTRVAQGTLTIEQASAAGARVARFHRSAAVRHDGPDYRERVDRNFEALLPLIEGVIPVGERLALQRFAAAFLLEWASVLDARAAAGSVVDGHGDLRATHVLFEPAGVSVVDPPRPRPAEAPPHEARRAGPLRARPRPADRRLTRPAAARRAVPVLGAVPAAGAATVLARSRCPGRAAASGRGETARG